MFRSSLDPRNKRCYSRTPQISPGAIVQFPPNISPLSRPRKNTQVLRGLCLKNNAVLDGHNGRQSVSVYVLNFSLITLFK